MVNSDTGCASHLSSKTSLDWYSCNLCTLRCNDSKDLFLRRWSTVIPVVRAILAVRPAPFNSSRVNPRPARSLMLYLKVGHLTIGLKVFTGLGATLAAFRERFFRRRSFLAGWLNQVFTYVSQSLWKWAFGII